jgi:hypothetical protein
MHHLEGGGAAIDDDRLAILHRVRGLRRSPASGGHALIVSLTENGRPASDRLNCGGLMASAPPRTRRKTLLHMQRRDIPPDRRFRRSVRSTSSGTVMTGLSWTADRMILWRSFRALGSSNIVYASINRAVSITNNHIFSLCSAI